MFSLSPPFKVCGWQYTGQAVDEFRYRWNNYKDNNRKSLKGNECKQAGFFAHFQSLDHHTEITLTKQTCLTQLGVRSFGLIG